MPIPDTSRVLIRLVRTPHSIYLIKSKILFGNGLTQFCLANLAIYYKIHINCGTNF